jgi:hypothetical protein
MFSNMSKSEPIPETVTSPFQNFNSEIIKKLETENRMCKVELVQKELQIIKYVNQTIMLNSTIEQHQEEKEQLMMMIKNEEEEVLEVEYEKNSVVLEKDKE